MAAAELLSVRRIWDRAPHNAFCDLVRHDDRWWCTFREGTDHGSGDGALRVIVSDDTERWESAARVALPGSDLRDPKLSVTPDDTLLLLAGERHRDEADAWVNSTRTWLSADGATWHGPFTVGEPRTWIWRVTWQEGVAWGVGYGCGEERFIRLYRSRTGTRFERVGQDLYTEGFPNEAALAFCDCGSCLCLLRMDGEGATGKLGVSEPPYTSWRWSDLGIKIGGPALLRLPDTRYVTCVRLYDERVRTSLLWLDPDASTLTEFLELPSGGDTSYAGMVWHEDLLWVAYYSSHEEKTSIYLARVRLG